MDHKEKPDPIPIVQSVLTESPSHHRGNVCPVTAFMESNCALPIKHFIRSGTVKQMTLTDLQVGSAFNVEKLLKLRDELEPPFQSSLTEHHKQARNSRSRGRLPNFTEGDHVLIAGYNFYPGKNPAFDGMDHVVSKRLSKTTSFKLKMVVVAK